MRNTIISLTAALLLSGTFLATNAFAQRRDRDRDDDRRQWVDLGCQQVSVRGRDRDTIRVGRREGRFRAIRLAARGNDVEVLRLSVVYGNGNPDELDVQRVIRSGDRTEAIDLKGRDRAIERIDVTYRQRPNFSGRATVCAQGMLG